jgi:hypothetical protein
MKNTKAVQFFCTKKNKWVDYAEYECKRNWNKLSSIQKSVFIKAVKELGDQNFKYRIVNRVK